MSSTWTTYPHLKLKLVVGFLVGFAVLAPLAFFVIGGDASEEQPGPGLTTLGVLVGWAVAFPTIVLLIIRPNIERYQQQDRGKTEPED